MMARAYNIVTPAPKLGASNPNWKGDEVGYMGLHGWVKRNFKRPANCQLCGTITAKRYEWANFSGKYLRERSDWLNLCRGCHVKFDKHPWTKREITTHCKYGHEWTPDTTHYDKRGYRDCRQCRRDQHYQNKATRNEKSRLYWVKKKELQNGTK